MARMVTRILPAIALVIFAAGEVRAGGFGLYGSYGEGTVSAERDTSGGEYDFDQKSARRGVGLVYASNVLEEKPFGWKLALGYEEADLEEDGGALPSFGGESYRESEYKGRLVLEGDLEYGRMAGSRLRFWGGAATRLAFHSGQDDNRIGPRDQKVFSAGIGPAVGVNVGLTERVALAFRGGYLLSYHQGRWTDWSILPRHRDDMTATEGNWFVGAALLLKTGPLSWLDDEDEPTKAEPPDNF